MPWNPMRPYDYGYENDITAYIMLAAMRFSFVAMMFCSAGNPGPRNFWVVVKL